MDDIRDFQYTLNSAGQVVPVSVASLVNLTEQVYYPDHAPRKESATFLHTKSAGHAAKLPCAISGRAEATEYHHVFSNGRLPMRWIGKR